MPGPNPLLSRSRGDAADGGAEKTSSPTPHKKGDKGSSVALGASAASASGGVSLPPLRTEAAQRVAAAAAGHTRTSAAVSVRSTQPMTTTGSRGPMMHTDRTLGSVASSSLPRGQRKPVKTFRGAAMAEPNSALPPMQSALPDMSNWQSPSRRQPSIAARMHEDKLAEQQRYAAPYKSDRLRQPEALRCTPVPTSDAGGRADVLDKPTVLAATVRSLPKNVSPILQQKSFRELTVPDMVRVLNDVARLTGGSRVSPAQVAERERAAKDPLETPEYSMSQVDEFDKTIADKLAFGKFLNGSRARLPNMVLRHFRHQLLDESVLARNLRALPLSRIEHELEALGPRTINAHQWNGLLIRLVGDSFSRIESHTLFTFFDTDTDGDVDQRELCNGFVNLRSADGPMLSVLHRVSAFLQQNIKDTRLTFISRFELVLMAEAITVASDDKLSTRRRNELRQALDALLSSFNTNKRGEFPFDEVRALVLKSKSIVNAIRSYTVPREKELYESSISSYLRNGDTDDGEQPFRLMMSLKAVDKSLRAAAAVSAAAANNNGPAGAAAGGSAGSHGGAPAAAHGGPLGVGKTLSAASVLSDAGSPMGSRVGRIPRGDLDDPDLDSEDSDYEAEQERVTGTLGLAKAAADAPASQWHNRGQRGSLAPATALTEETLGAALETAAASTTADMMDTMDGTSLTSSGQAGGVSGDAALMSPAAVAAAAAAAAAAEDLSYARSRAVKALMTLRRPAAAGSDDAFSSSVLAPQSTIAPVPTMGRAGSRRATVVVTPRTDDTDTQVVYEDPLANRPVHEPGHPVFFTLRGTLYRQIDGEEPQPYWVAGMPANIKYSERR